MVVDKQQKKQTNLGLVPKYTVYIHNCFMISLIKVISCREYRIFSIERRTPIKLQSYITAGSKLLFF